MMNKRYYKIAGLTFSVDCNNDYDFGAADYFFIGNSSDTEDFSYKITDCKFKDNGELVHRNDIFSVYKNDNLIIRKFSNVNGDFSLVRKADNPFSAVLYGNRTDISNQQGKLIASYLALEVPLMHKGAYILHSSVVELNGQAVVFSGASGKGKSTQAELWQKHKNAEIINGDRSIIRNNKTVHAYGSVFAGSSQIYKNKNATIRAIVFLEKGETNSLKLLSPTEGFKMIYSQSLNNTWDKEYVKRLLEEIQKTVSAVPVYKYSCTKDKEAVDYLYNELFR